MKLSTSSRTISKAALIWSAVAVSTMSLDVAPRWTYFPASPLHFSVMAFTMAMRSCLVSFSISLILSTLTTSRLATLVISLASSSEMVPRDACALARAASTYIWFWMRLSSENTAFMSSRPYL